MSSYLKKKYYIYYEKGVAEATVQNIVFNWSICATNYIVLTIEIVDNLGLPFFASYNKLGLEWGKFNEQVKIFNQFTNKSEKYYKQDNEHITFFARYKQYYFGYRDNEKIWGDKEVQGYSCSVIYPYRSVVRFNQNKVQSVWHERLDPFGTPCD
ncbi:MAG: hypothetical protein EXR21_00880 [Flavobacteriaceae bacterium]|nr:hypothetical protein [Flavobacteriaceae bacterium]